MNRIKNIYITTNGCNRMKLITIILALGIWSCAEPKHTTEIVEVKVPMESNGDYVVWSSAQWNNPSSYESVIEYLAFVTYVGEDTTTGNIATLTGYVWDSAIREMADSTKMTIADTFRWVPEIPNQFDWYSDAYLPVTTGYEFLGISLKVEK